MAGELITYADPATGARRDAWIEAGRLRRVLFLSAGGELPPRGWLAELFEADALPPEARATLLFGRPPGRRVDPGPMVCACLKIGQAAIVQAIARGCSDTEAVGATTGAGTNCGSCRPEIAGLIAANATEGTRHAA